MCQKSGWFGNECQYQCHCMDGDKVCSRDTGECRGKCAQGWFGPACQYVVLNTKQNARQPTWLTDSDSNNQTCNDDYRQTVEVELETPQPISWLRGTTQNIGMINLVLT
ncbi:multiple epidermal growth factor-like domains protein 10 [Plakobranchus ocellatus]|uniref:Multiple epidermal growth factor-like domains protein 10 n=1 Tax=Plakobranchus ocellatus TaxID=259542 RepID=A0AAV4B6G6_9GAST|nr:multiple epidermal growth factor-like domains protein 10 [Plakobranchus ocellatus]